MNQEKMFDLPKTKVKVFVVNVNDQVKDETIKIANRLRENNIPCQTDLMNRNLKNQLEFANSLGIPFVIIVGPEEIKKKIIRLREMKQRKETVLKFEELIKKLWMARVAYPG